MHNPGLRVIPAVVEVESADTVTVVLVAAVAVEGSEGTLQAGPVGVGCVPVAAVEAETVPAVAVRRAAEAPVWILGSWTGPVIQGVPGNLAAVQPERAGPAAERRATGQIAGLTLVNKGVETVEALVMGLVVAPEMVLACGAADTIVLPGCVAQTSAVGAFDPGTVSGHPVVLLGAASRGFAAGLGEESGRAGRNMVPGPESHSLLVPAVRKSPSTQNTQKTKTSNQLGKKTQQNNKKLRLKAISEDMM